MSKVINLPIRHNHYLIGKYVRGIDDYEVFLVASVENNYADLVDYYGIHQAWIHVEDLEVVEPEEVTEVKKWVKI